ncbi:tyrosine phosphatase [Oryctes borbonicus]|uniref:Tyrosine phosphatase n=1 Tax=Oryctes borbonicus TaxID=1629725 RepID=A0A0T6B714_9SCAR|nr:tyrosine phosphatase [Oryctes borbonicus]
MEAAPRLPMICFHFKISTEKVSFESKLKEYIAEVYHEDPNSYSNEIYELECLRAAATRPTEDISSCQLLKEYYCQLHFLKSRFPMEERQPCAIYFSWKDTYTNVLCSVQDINFELMCILYNIGALHTQLGAADKRSSPEGMKMSCTHFQCAAWAFQTLRETYSHMVALHEADEITHAMQLICLAQAQECILEKSMLDNRKATIISKVAVQVMEYYKQALSYMQAAREDCELLRTEKYTLKYLAFKCEYHRAIALLYQGQQSEEQQKMGERVAFYQAALDHHEEARKHAASMSSSLSAPFKEALAFTLDVIEGKRKAAKNENEYIYHEEVPDKQTLQEVKGASLVKGIPFSIYDTEVSGPDIFAKLVPIEAHEASSLYSEQKAKMLRKIGELVDVKNQALSEFMSSLQLEILSQMHQAKGLPQEIVDRAAALAARPSACQDLVAVMSKLSNSYHDVEAMLRDIQQLLKEEQQKEKEYQTIMGKRPPSIIATDLSREAAKYQEAHGKASESNQNLHKAMTAHVANIKILAMPLAQLQQHIPSIDFPNPNVDETRLAEIQKLVGKVEEMRNQRTMLWGQLRDAVHQDDITGILVTKQNEPNLDQLFQKELDKHKKLADLIEQNATAQDNICKALVDTYAQFTSSRKYLQDVLNKRTTVLQNLIGSYDMYEDLLSKANKGIEFYDKLETNVSKLFQRIKSACKVQDEEREQILLKNNQLKGVDVSIAGVAVSRAPKLKDYLDNMKADKLAAFSVDGSAAYPAAVYQPIVTDSQQWPPAVRPAPVGSEITTTTASSLANMKGENRIDYGSGQVAHGSYGTSHQYNQVYTYSAGYNSPITNPGANYMNPVTTASAVTQPDYTTYSAASAAINTTASADSTYNPTNYIPTASNGTGNIGQANYNYNMAGYNYYQYSTQPTTQSQDVSQNIQQSYPTSYPQSTYGTNTSNVAHQPTPYTQPSTYNQNIDSQAMYHQAGYMAGMYGGTVTQGGYVQPDPQVTYTTASYVQPTNQMYSQGNYTQPVTQTTYVSPTTQTSYAQPTTQSNYVQPTTQTNYTQPTTQNLSSGKSLDDILSEKMAALMPNSRKDPNSNPYVPSQYPQYDYASGYAHPNHYSYANTNIPASSYYTMSNTSYPYVTTSEQSSLDASGYGSGATTTVTTTVADSTYTYGEETGTYPAGYYQTAQSTTATDGQTPSAYNANMYTANPYGTTYSDQTSTLNAQGQDQAYMYQQYYAQNTSQYYNYPQQQDNSSTIAYDAQSYYNHSTIYTTEGQQPTQPSAASTTAVASQPKPETSTAKKVESSIDLLSGIDFNISVTPLMPQQKTEKAEEKEKEVPKSKVVDTPPTVPIIPISKPEENLKPVTLIRKKITRPTTDPFQNTEVVKQFVQEVDKFEKFCDTLITKTLNGPTTLDLKWKEIQDRQDNESYNKSISIARCYPLKNRFPDILPYDYSRVELRSTKDDYINASYVKDASQNCPVYIVTQAPTQTTTVDFWAMIWEQEIELMICLLNKNEVSLCIAFWIFFCEILSLKRNHHSILD